MSWSVSNLRQTKCQGGAECDYLGSRFTPRARIQSQGLETLTYDVECVNFETIQDDEVGGSENGLRQDLNHVPGLQARLEALTSD